MKPFRERYDPSAAAGLPAHITLLYPFKPPDDINAAVLNSLRRLFAKVAPFRFSLGIVRRFDAPVAVLYLAPEPDEVFRQLTMPIWQRYPEKPPYRGSFEEIVPHLCLAQLASLRRCDHVADEFCPGQQREVADSRDRDRHNFDG